MMGSSSQQQELLGAMLVLVTDPKAVAKNIEALSAKMADLEEVNLRTSEALKRLAEAQARIVPIQEDLSKSQRDIADQQERINTEDARLQQERAALETERSLLKQHREKLSENIGNHAIADADLKKRERDLKRDQAAVCETLDRREAKLGAREDTVATREQAVADKEFDLKARAQKMKDLAHA